MSPVESISRLALLHGRDEPLQEPRTLRAGPLTAVLDGVELRYLRLGAVEVVRGIYVSVRDRNWNTIPAAPSRIEADEAVDSFEVRFSARNASAEVDFAWEGAIVGHADGRVAFSMEGEAERDMLYNRVGLCVLHPWRETAGGRFCGRSPDGPVEGVFPELVAPQRTEGAVYVSLFPALSRLEIDLADGGAVRFEFEGDLFEAEDQRNWADASFKTYCNPMAVPRPLRLERGRRLRQAVLVSAERGPRARGGARPARLEIGGPTGSLVPPVGLGSLVGDLSGSEAELLRALGPAHLRHELHLDGEWEPGLRRALAACADLGAALELALFVRPGGTERLSAVRGALAEAEVARVLVLGEDARTATPEETTPPELVRAVRGALGLEDVPVAGGTDMYFCELNRTRPQVAAMDGVCWSLNPQVHAFDDLSVLETPEAIGEQVRAAQAFAGGKPLFVGPVTLKRRRNVNATTAEDAPVEDLPDSVDARQASLLGAAWTAASAKHLAEQGAAAVTFFEPVGWRGVVQGDEPPALPDEFPGRAGQAFPLYHVLADVCELRGATVLACETTRPLEVAGLAVRNAGGESLIMANLTPRALSVEVRGLAGTPSIRRLNEESAERAAYDPRAFRDTFERMPATHLELGPYETARIDVRKEARST